MYRCKTSRVVVMQRDFLEVDEQNVDQDELVVTALQAELNAGIGDSATRGPNVAYCRY